MSSVAAQAKIDRVMATGEDDIHFFAGYDGTRQALSDLTALVSDEVRRRGGSVEFLEDWRVTPELGWRIPLRVGCNGSAVRRGVEFSHEFCSDWRSPENGREVVPRVAELLLSPGLADVMAGHTYVRLKD